MAIKYAMNAGWEYSYRPSVTSLSRSTIGAFLLLFAISSSAAEANNILYEKWDGISGGSVSDLTTNAAFPENPSSSSYLDGDYFEAPTNVDDNFGCRLTGYFLAPESGDYVFKMASDDGGQLSLDGNVIASALGSSGGSWTKFSSQTSTAISLSAGSVYKMVGLMKEGRGSDHFSAGTTLPSGTELYPIPASYFTAFPTTECDAGNGNTWDGSAWTCESCPQGKFSLDSALLCTSCVPGTYSGTTGATTSDTCQLCEAGTGSSRGSSSCSTCEAGTYGGGGTACLRCPDDNR